MNVRQALIQLLEGDFRALAITGSERNPNVPDVPTYEELGYSIFSDFNFGLVAPAGTPPEILAKLEATIRDVSQNEVFAEAIAPLGAEQAFLAMGEFQDRLTRIIDAVQAVAANGGNGGTAPPARTSRAFTGPHEYPPQEFAAYGIVVFPALATATTRSRHLTVCRAYVATLPTPSQLFIPASEQMVTVWPVVDEGIASELTDRSDDEVCEAAVGHYHLGTALTALAHARATEELAFRGRGPFLLAWSPSADKGSPDALVLVADLSTATIHSHFEDHFRRWREDIELSPELWSNGWSVLRIRVIAHDWLDEQGLTILSLMGVLDQ